MAAREVSLSLQTLYAELLDRVTAAAFDSAFPEAGTFISKSVRGRRYWYFQTSAEGTKAQRYVGPESPELLERIATHRVARDQDRDRRKLIATLARSAGLPKPPAAIGEVIAVLAAAGVFRLRGVLVGTVAFQTYAAMLGVRLPGAALQTLDIDIAQFRDISVAVEERISGMLEILRGVDPSFREVPRLNEPGASTSYACKQFRVDFLTPNRGPETDKAQPLPALGTHGQPLRFLDFLLRDPEPAVLLHGAGIAVVVPSPQRYAVHKLIVSQRRAATNAKRQKDLMQAETLLTVLLSKQPEDLHAVLAEARSRGPQWRTLIDAAAARMPKALQTLLGTQK